MDLGLFLPPLVACLIIVAIHSYLGLHVLAREVIFVDLSLAQMAALGSRGGDSGGQSAGFAAWPSSTRSASPRSAPASSPLTRTNERGRVPQEAIIGIVYVVASAAAILVADRTPRGGEAIKDILVGSLLWVTWPTIFRLAGGLRRAGRVPLGAAPALPHDLVRRRRPRSRKGWNIRLWDFLLLSVVRDRDHVLGADRGRAAGVLVPGRAGGDRVPVHPATGGAGGAVVDRGRARVGGRAVAVVPVRSADRAAHRVRVRACCCWWRTRCGG